MCVSSKDSGETVCACMRVCVCACVCVCILLAIFGQLYYRELAIICCKDCICLSGEDLCRGDSMFSI